MTQIHLAVALEGAGWHPSAWRLPAARPRELTSAGYWTDLVQEAERGLLDLVTLEDSFSVRSAADPRGGPPHDTVVGRLDAVLVAARVAPLTEHVGLVPTVTVTHTEPFHVSVSLATLDHVSHGRAGWQVRVSDRADEARHVGRREVPVDGDDRLVHEAEDAVEVVRRLWDSWEDDAEIRDVATGRFVDRDKLHHVDFEGPWFEVRGPSITPRPPQGQPLVTGLVVDDATLEFAARTLDVAFVTPTGVEETSEIVRAVHALDGHRPEPVRVLADLVVVLDDREGEAARRLDRLDAWSGGALVSDAEVFVGTPEALADLVEERGSTGIDGFRLRPAALPEDLHAIAGSLVPALQRRGLFRAAYDEGSLRQRLGLPRPANRYARTS